jgi:hypothetical protein
MNETDTRGEETVGQCRGRTELVVRANNAELQLTSQERQLITNFRAMDEEAQEFTLATARSQARHWPKERPRLALVQAGHMHDQFAHPEQR